MWPSGVKHSFGGFCGSMFVVGAGLSTLETAADPFLSICGPPRYSEIRLNLAQAVQAVGSFVAPLLASRVFFAKTVDTAQGLKNVQWVYLGVACFVGLLVILFFIAPMPEITDADMGTQEMEIAEYDPGPFRKQINLFLAVWSQFCYVGAQVAVANYFVNFCEEAGKSASTSGKSLRTSVSRLGDTDVGDSRHLRRSPRPLRIQSFPCRRPHDNPLHQTPLHPRHLPRHVLHLRPCRLTIQRRRLDRSSLPRPLLGIRLLRNNLHTWAPRSWSSYKDWRFPYRCRYLRRRCLPSYGRSCCYTFAEAGLKETVPYGDVDSHGRVHCCLGLSGVC